MALQFQGTIQFRRGTSAEWTQYNPILSQGELGMELDTNKFKFGNGTKRWSELAYGGLRGLDGMSAYEVWLELGNMGSESQFIASMHGLDGRSAYQIWLDNGYVGTEADFLLSLKGEPGPKGDNGTGSGTVKKVNGQDPDGLGAVVIDIGVKTVNNIAPDASGNVVVGAGAGTVKSVNHNLPDGTGDVTIAIPDVTGMVKSVNHVNPVAGDVTLNVGVLTVNGTAPDVNGNVTVTAGGSGTVKSVNTIQPDVNGDVTLPLPFIKTVNGTSPTTNGNLPLNVGVLTINSQAPDVNGNFIINNGSGTVKSVNALSPDVNGNVSLTAANVPGTVQTVNGATPNGAGNVVVPLPFVKTVNGSSPDVNGNVTVAGGSGTVLTVNSKTPGGNGNVVLNAADIPNSVLTVNGYSPNSSGNVVVGVPAGVSSFNGRSGVVVPANGDYTPSMVGAIPTTDKGIVNGIATLGSDGKLTSSQLPNIAAGRKLSVANKAARLALLAYADLTIAYQTDDLSIWSLNANDDPSVEANWTSMGTSAVTGVTTFNGRQGAVVPSNGDYTPSMVGAAPAVHTHTDGSTTTSGFITAAQVAKLNSLDALTPASDIKLGGIKVGDNLTIDPATGVLSTTSKGTLVTLNDVIVTNPVVGETILYNGAKWANGPVNSPIIGGGNVKWYSPSSLGISLSQGGSTIIEHDPTTSMHYDVKIWEKGTNKISLPDNTLDFEWAARDNTTKENDNLVIYRSLGTRTLLKGEWIQLENVTTGFEVDKINVSQFGAVETNSYWWRAFAVTGVIFGETVPKLIALFDDVHTEWGYNGGPYDKSFAIPKAIYKNLRITILAGYGANGSVVSGVKEIEYYSGATKTSPTMTSASTAGFTCTTSSQFSGSFPGWNAFDGNKVGENGWLCLNGYVWNGGLYTGATVGWVGSGIVGSSYFVTSDANAFHLENIESILTVNFTQTVPANTSIKYLVSFDGRLTWNRWNGSAWVAVAGTTIRDKLTAGSNTSAEVKTGLTSFTVFPVHKQIDFVVDLSTTVSTATPSIDLIQIQYQSYPTWHMRATDGTSYDTEQLTQTKTRITKLTSGVATIYPVVITPTA